MTNAFHVSFTGVFNDNEIAYIDACAAQRKCTRSRFMREHRKPRKDKGTGRAQYSARKQKLTPRLPVEKILAPPRSVHETLDLHADELSNIELINRHKYLSSGGSPSAGSAPPSTASGYEPPAQVSVHSPVASAAE